MHVRRAIMSIANSLDIHVCDGGVWSDIWITLQDIEADIEKAMDDVGGCPASTDHT